MSEILDMISRTITPIANIATKWQFWAVVLGVFAIAFVMFLLYPALKAAMQWAGRTISMFLGM